MAAAVGKETALPEAPPPREPPRGPCPFPGPPRSPPARPHQPSPRCISSARRSPTAPGRHFRRASAELPMRKGRGRAPPMRRRLARGMGGMGWLRWRRVSAARPVLPSGPAQAPAVHWSSCSFLFVCLFIWVFLLLFSGSELGGAVGTWAGGGAAGGGPGRAPPSGRPRSPAALLGRPLGGAGLCPREGGLKWGR